MFTILGPRRIQYLASYTVSILALTFGAMVWASPTLPQLQKPNSPIGVQLSPEQGTWVVSIVYLGLSFGSIVVGPLLDLCGRRGLLLLSTVPIFISWMLILFANSFAILVGARFLYGLGVSPFIGGVVYITEITEAEIRGRLSMLNLMMVELGAVFITAIGGYLSYTTTAICASLIPVIFLATFFWMPESPYYYLRKGNVEHAKKSLQRLRSSTDVDAELLEIQISVEKEMSNKSSFWDIFRVKQYRKVFIIVLGLKTLQQMSGFAAINNYLVTIFNQVSSGLNSTESSIISTSVAIPAVWFGSLLIDRVGRKPLYYTSIIGSAVALFCEFLYFCLQDRMNYDVSSVAWLPVLGIIVFNMFRTLAIHTIPMLIVSELLPTNIKGYGMSLFLVYSTLLGFVISLLFPYAADFFGMDLCFLIFSICCVLGLFFVMYIVPETKGKTLHNIQNDMNSDTVRESSLELK